MHHVSQCNTTQTSTATMSVCVRSRSGFVAGERKGRQVFCPFLSSSALRSVTLPVEGVYPSTDVSEGVLSFSGAKYTFSSLQLGDNFSSIVLRWRRVVSETVFPHLPSDTGTPLTSLFFRRSRGGKHSTVSMPLDRADHFQELCTSQCTDWEPGDSEPSPPRKSSVC